MIGIDVSANELLIDITLSAFTRICQAFRCHTLHGETFTRDLNTYFRVVLRLSTRDTGNIVILRFYVWRNDPYCHKNCT